MFISFYVVSPSLDQRHFRFLFLAFWPSLCERRTSISNANHPKITPRKSYIPLNITYNRLPAFKPDIAVLMPNYHIHQFIHISEFVKTEIIYYFCGRVERVRDLSATSLPSLPNRIECLQLWIGVKCVCLCVGALRKCLTYFSSFSRISLNSPKCWTPFVQSLITSRSPKLFPLSAASSQLVEMARLIDADSIPHDTRRLYNAGACVCVLWYWSIAAVTQMERALRTLNHYIFDQSNVNELNLCELKCDYDFFFYA